MARPKAFDPDAALDRAMDLFWQKGYEATSIQDLVNHVGINRASLYGTFGGKHDIFLAAVEHYINAVVIERFKALNQHESGVEAIGEFFRKFAEMATTDATRRGCLVANSIMELAARDKDAAERVGAALKWVEGAFYKALMRSRANGELNGRHTPRALARSMTCLLLGATAMAKAGADAKTLRDAIEVGLSVLD